MSPYDDGRPFYTSATAVPPCLSLKDAMAAMTPSAAKRRVRALKASWYDTPPYTQAKNFVKDIAALAIVHRSLLKRRNASKSTVLASLKFASHGAQLQYLFNGPRFMARRSHAARMAGTTSCEAVHGELVRFFKSTFQLTARTAASLVSLFGMRRMIADAMKRMPLGKKRQPADLLQLGAEQVRDMGLDWSDLVRDLAPQANPSVDVATLDKNAKLSSCHVGKRRRLK